MCTVCFSAPLEVVAGWFPWSPLEVGIRYLSGAACLCMRGDLVVLFTNGKIKPIQNKTKRAPLIKRKAASERYRIPTSKGDKGNQPATTSKGALEQTVHTFLKNKNITINSVDDQEPIARRTRSSKSTEKFQTTKRTQKKSEPIAQRTRSKTFEQKYTTPSNYRALATQLLTHMANSVLEQETGKQLNYGQLRKHPRLQET